MRGNIHKGEQGPRKWRGNMKEQPHEGVASKEPHRGEVNEK
jgi:hypothetical protein